MTVFNNSCMKYDFDKLETGRIRELIARANLTEKAFCKALWGERTHQVLANIERRPDVRASTLVKIASILNCSIDDLFLLKDRNETDNPSVIGNNNVVNSHYVNTDIPSLKAEIKALRMLIDEKNARIEDLKKANTEVGKRLDLVLSLKDNARNI